MTFSILNNKNFRNFFLADIISGFGSGMSFIGANWFVLEQTGRNSSVGLLLSITLFSGLCVFPFAGTIADRFNRRDILFWSNTVRGALIALTAAAILIGSFDIKFLYFLSAVAGMGWITFIPASRGLVQEILQKDELMQGNSLIEISMQVGMFMAAAASGIVYKYFGFAAILLTDAATFFVSNLYLRKIIYEQIAAHDADESFAAQFKNGLKYLVENRAIFGFGIIMFIPFVATMSSNVVLPGYVSSHLQKDSVVFGLADMFYGIGACLSGFIALLPAVKLSKFKAVAGFFILSILSLVFLAVNRFIAGLFIASSLFGLCNSSLRIILNTIAMEIVPKTFFGRAMSVWMAASLIMQIASASFAGIIMDASSPRFGFLWLAVIMCSGFYFARHFNNA